MITSPRENSWGVAHEVESVPTIFFENKTGETSGGSLVQRQKDALMVPNSRENSRGGRAPRETSGRLADMGKISPRVVSVRSNTGETPGSRPLQRQKDALMISNPRENSWGGARFQRDLWKAGGYEKYVPSNSLCTIKSWRDPR